MDKNQVKVIQTGVGTVGKISLIQELRKNNSYVIGTDVNPMSCGLYICDKGYVISSLVVCDHQKMVLFCPSFYFVIIFKTPFCHIYPDDVFFHI